jgi:hypothetical protein
MYSDSYAISPDSGIDLHGRQISSWIIGAIIASPIPKNPYINKQLQIVLKNAITM